MRGIRKTVLAVLLVTSLLVGFSSNSRAAPYFEIQVSDGTVSQVIQDNLNGQDLDPRFGIINWTGSVGNWNLEVQIAQTYDILGSASAPKIDLASVNNSTAAGTLTIDVSAMGFRAPPSLSSAQVAIGGTTLPNGDGTITAQLFGGNSNVLLDKSNFIVSTGPLAGNAAGVFGSSAIGGFTPVAGNFSLTSEVVIHHDVAGTSTFDDNNVARVSEPFTLIFLGSCLLGTGMVSMVSRKAKV